MGILNKVSGWMFRRRGFVFGLLFFLSPVSLTFLRGEEPVILGSRERVALLPEGIVLDARIDTGAALSSLHGEDIKIFREKEQEKVRFSLTYQGENLCIERPLFSRVFVRQAGSLAPRPTILLDIVLGGNRLKGEFSLADRSAMSVPVLIGRNILSGWALVDVSEDYLLGLPSVD